MFEEIQKKIHPAKNSSINPTWVLLDYWYSSIRLSLSFKAAIVNVDSPITTSPVSSELSHNRCYDLNDSSALPRLGNSRLRQSDNTGK